ncbi:MAG: sigma-E processing peptidase SpoIIGA [Candidatus Improbicoccus pseudotrichonymphae]|uniref:Sigma-E processing peptidase SpoIIGA n=1 Tax=Candidatus Improbicoccus pseudotrichonymphae TaxID=3033792 RepID=A0AA48IAJ6_9FIRM|nr:MAG: sigma-E processing peptidase SpoIIGA [Candidatus Improbicoccus pseudotrichonymphae]
MEIYADIFVVLNMLSNYFIIFMVSKILFIRIEKIRAVSGALVGALISAFCELSLQHNNIIFLFLFRSLIYLIVAILTFGIKNRIRFIKSFICFYLTSFVFSGTFLYLVSILGNTFFTKGLNSSRGFLYIKNASPSLLLISMVVIYLVFEIVERMVKKKGKADFYRINVQHSKHLISFDARLDTCNDLKEPFSGLPVILVDKKIICNILPDGFTLDKFEYFGDLGYNVRLIPYDTVSGKGVLLAFKPDSIVVETSDSKFKREGYLAVCSDCFVEENMAMALVGKNLIV